VISFAASITAGDRMVNSVLEGTVIAVVVSFLLWLAPKGNSRTRFAVWYLTLIAIVALPLTYWREVARSAAVPSLPHLTLPGSWATDALIAWAAISFLGLLRIARGLWKLHSLKQRCGRLYAADLPAGAWKGLGSSRRIQYCVSDELSAPTAIGFFRPAVLLPRWTTAGLSADELNRVLLHEVGHLQRWDDWTNLVQKVLRALLFFHPAVWWIDSRLALERESACDDLVLAQAPDTRAYAECLVSIAEKSRLRQGIALAVAAVGRMRQIAVRLTRILDTNRASGTGLSKVALGFTIVLGVMVLFALPHLPDLVEFKETSPATTADASVKDAGERMVHIHKLAVLPVGKATPGIVPVAMRIPARDVSHIKLTKVRGNLVRNRPEQHLVISQMVISQTLIPERQQLFVEPTFLVFVATQYAVSNDSRWIMQPASDVLLGNPFDPRDGSRNGTFRVLRLTIFSEAGVVREGVVSNVI